MSNTHRNVLLFACRTRLFSVRTVSSTASTFAPKKDRLKKLEIRSKKAKDGFPPEFEQKLKQWPQLLQAEKTKHKEQVKELREQHDGDWKSLEQRGIAQGGLRIVNETLTFDRGLVVTLNTPRRSRCDFRKGLPLTLVTEDKLRTVAECTFLSDANNDIQIRVSGKFSKKLEKGNTYALIPSSSIGVLQAIEDLVKDRFSSKYFPGGHLLRYGFRATPMPSVHADRPVRTVSQELNEAQQHAVAAGLNPKRPFVCIQGPPGTGKTRVLAEIVKELVKKRQKVLVCAPSHVAVDNAMTATEEVIRKDLGLEAKVDLQNEFEEEKELPFKIMRAETSQEALQGHQRYEGLSNISTHLQEQLDIERADDKFIGDIKHKYYTEYHAIMRDIYQNTRVVYCTLTSKWVRDLRRHGFNPDVVIIDEAAQCIEPVCWSAIVRAKRCILVGDPSQLPATILSHTAKEGGLHVSLMERMCSDFSSSNIKCLLNVQYRMNEAIMRWSSDNFYESQLVAHESAKNNRLSDIGKVPEDSLMNSPLLFFDTDHKTDAAEFSYKKSIQNIGEVDIALDYVNLLVEAGVNVRDIAIISPYFAQTARIRDEMVEGLSANTVDAYQGQEREVIIFSFVRNNPNGVIGFLSEMRRMNVAVTRARCQFVLIGSRRMMCKYPLFKKLIECVESCGGAHKPSAIKQFSKDLERADPGECVATAAKI